MSDYMVSAVLTAKDANMSATMEKVAHQTEKAKQVVEGFKDKFKEAFTLGTGIAMGEKAADFVLDKVKELAAAAGEFAEKADKIALAAEKAGMSAEDYQRLAYAFHMVDIPAETMDKAFKKLNVGLAQMRVHQGPLIEGLKRMNPELLHSLSGAKSNQEAFSMVAEAIAKTKDASEKAAIANAVFGKSGTDLLPLLNKGAEGVAELTAEASKYGDVMGNEAVAAGQRFDDAQKKLNGTLAQVGNTIMGTVVEAMAPMIEAFAEFVEQNKEVIPAVAAVVGILAAVAVVVGVVAAAVWVMNSALWANPLVWIVAAVVAGIAVLVGIILYLRSTWNDTGNAFTQTARVIIEVLGRIGQTIMAVLLSPINLVIDGILMLLDAASKIPGIGDGFKAAADGIRGFQDGMNKTLTGSATQTDLGGIWSAKAPNAPALGVQTEVKNSTKVEVIAPAGYQVNTQQQSKTSGGRGAPASTQNKRDEATF